ncbi:hypothetical protein ACQKFO_10300 [Rossellomorea sp. NPDC071047]|uniref:hypothetical protein n=1 Tax=Rossellomorea sp. NPDC071047 TaxID=3390675 RepID=UPI003D03D911
MKQNLFIMGILMFLLAACSNQEEITDPHFMWSGNKYITTYEPVEEERLAERVGVIKTEVEGPIDENGESMGLPEDTELYRIDDQKESPADMLAYHIGNRFYIARKLDVYQ